MGVIPMAAEAVGEIIRMVGAAVEIADVGISQGVGIMAVVVVEEEDMAAADIAQEEAAAAVTEVNFQTIQQILFKKNFCPRSRPKWRK